jgi:hypothetical protein
MNVYLHNGAVWITSQQSCDLTAHKVVVVEVKQGVKGKYG